MNPKWAVSSAVSCFSLKSYYGLEKNFKFFGSICMKSFKSFKQTVVQFWKRMCSSFILGIMLCAEVLLICMH